MPSADAPSSLPSRVLLGQDPTRIRSLPHLGARLGGTLLFVNHDDETGSVPSGGRTLFLHTGGVFSLFPFRDELLGPSG
jgi:1-aminocyclopropane-1-carboxylate deaminase/D-cysteine desulfhydrase-like pyridoxal-dependent ACC family enzyme